jgi:hypothetical protein
LEQEKARKAAKTQGGKAEAWLVGYLAGKGEVSSDEVIAAGIAAGFSRPSIYRAKGNCDRIDSLNTNTYPKTSLWWLVEK